MIFVFACGISLSLCSARTGPITAFKKLQGLAGEWVGRDDQGRVAKTTFKAMVSNTAVLETLSPPEMEDMISIYSLDGEGIAMIHYCPTNNQPHMRALPGAGEEKELIFEFQNAGNLPSLETGHQHKLVLHFEDDDHISESWTWRQNGKDFPMVIHFTRKKK